MRLVANPAKRALAWTCALALSISAQGCGGGASSVGNREQARAALAVLGLQYGSYLAEHNGAPPPDEKAMREFLESRLDELSAYNVKSADDLLGAGRDGQPVKIVVGAKVASPDQPQYPWAAYEQVGIDGKRLASNARGGVYELTAEEFAKQFPVK